MKHLYNESAIESSKLITHKYSTSFGLGIKTLAKSYRNPIYAIYGFVRLADEIVDTFFDYNQEKLLKEFKQQTYQAIEEGISMNPVLHSFQQVVNEYAIPLDLIESFLHSMELDLAPQTYQREIFDEYVYGSAEAVGLMCLKVFCGKDLKLYQELKPAAQSLGSAFQKINFLRDIQSDYEERGRTYFPGVNMMAFTEHDKKLIEQEITIDFEKALIGILQLPKGAKKGVLLAYKYYYKLFIKIKRTPAVKILNIRIRVPNEQKLLILVQTHLQTIFNIS